MTPQQNLYQALNDFTGGLRDYMRKSTDTSWKSNDSALSPAVCVALGENYLITGYYTKINGDLCGDPQYGIRVDHDAGTATTVWYETFPFSGRTNGGDDAEDAHVVESIRELHRRVKDGWLIDPRVVTYATEEGAP